MLPPSAWTIVDPVTEPASRDAPRVEPSARVDAKALRTPEAELTIRRARPDDAAALAALAALDSAPPLRGDVLLAATSGVPVAAIELSSGRVVADPFAPTREAADLLRLRAGQLAAAPGRPARRGRRFGHGRFATLAGLGR